MRARLSRTMPSCHWSAQLPDLVDGRTVQGPGNVSVRFIRYGLIDGEVISISDDAVQNERLGLVYAARVQMERTTMDIDGKTIQLSPGMAVSVEVKTGQRRSTEYLLSPVAKCE